MSELQIGQTIKTKDFKTVKVIQQIGEGGQGIVYRVDYHGKPMALKWYKDNAWKKPEAVYENLINNIKRGAPAEGVFLWPKDITEWVDGSFGYVMDLRPKEYISLTEVLVTGGGGGFRTFKALVEVCIQIVSAFRLLHNAGYSYQDMNSGNFFMNPRTGQVLIIDNDNVAPNGTNMGVVGTPQYMAPEIVASNAKPSTHTDEFSLAVVLFLMLCGNHPLEGKHWAVPCLTPDIEKALYGTNPIFVFDPENKENRPVKGVHNNVLARWGYLPKYIQEKFIQAFSQEAINNPNRRLKELDWLKVLVRFQSDIVRCPYCNNEIYTIAGKSTKCDGCGKMYVVKNSLELRDYSVPAVKKTRIYKCQLEVCNANEALTLIGEIVCKNNDPNILGFKNMSTQTLLGTSPSGNRNQIKPNDIIPVKAGISIQVSDSKINII